MNRFAILALATLTLSPAALAGPTIGLQTEVAAAPDDGPGPSGLGISGRLGYGLDLGLVELTPEVELASFSGTWVPKIGGRLMVGKGIEPGVYGHLILPVWRQTTPVRGWDAGAIVDFTATPLLDVGIHGGAMVLDSAASRQITPVFGVHASVSF